MKYKFKVSGLIYPCASVFPSVANKEFMPDDAPMDRRKFFRRGLAELLKPLASSIAPLERAARKIGELDAAAARATPERNKIRPDLWLRPPGAVSEKTFLSTCTRGGDCVK